MSGAWAAKISNVNEIWTSWDLYIEDIAMQKIIYYISLFSDDVKDHLSCLRSSKELLQNKDIDMPVGEDVSLDCVDKKLVSLILDVLEHFDMFRLCMIVCNWYALLENISRYLTSVCYRYSNIKLINCKFYEKINTE
mgnify:CR=1 FL=1